MIGSIISITTLIIANFSRTIIKVFNKKKLYQVWWHYLHSSLILSSNQPGKHLHSPGFPPTKTLFIELSQVIQPVVELFMHLKLLKSME